KSDFRKKAVYSVQAGAFENEKNALHLMDELQKKGYAVFIRMGEWKDNRPFYSVMVGEYEKREDAQAESMRIRRQEGIQSFVYAE
ncbi:MAG: hypothetical protein GTN68_17960, partial [Candidatus Aminicenantes bacterium]|nr:hypothetical protein [Candidatus Aminicenantes bacterium]